MPIIRIKKTQNFTTLSNTCLQDERLSAKAKGIHCYLLTLPDDWKIHLNELTKHFDDGISSIRSGITELIKYGYVSSYQIRNSNGMFDDVIYTVYEIPTSEKFISIKQHNVSQSDLLQTIELKAEECTLLNTNYTKGLTLIKTNNHDMDMDKNNSEEKEGSIISSGSLKKEISFSTVLERSEQQNRFENAVDTGCAVLNSDASINAVRESLNLNIKHDAIIDAKKNEERRNAVATIISNKVFENHKWNKQIDITSDKQIDIVLNIADLIIEQMPEFKSILKYYKRQLNIKKLVENIILFIIDETKAKRIDSLGYILKTINDSSIINEYKSVLIHDLEILKQMDEMNEVAEYNSVVLSSFQSDLIDEAKNIFN